MRVKHYMVASVGSVLRNRNAVLDGALLTAVTFGALAISYHYDVFAGLDVSAQSSPEKRIDLREALAVMALFCFGLAIFAMRRSWDARRETARRLSAEREAKTLALQDFLTGLPNRRHFDESLRAAIEAPPRAGGSHALFLMDLNGFKRINDRFGHAVGDEVLMQVGARLTRAVREGDLVARLGGDEFGVLALHLAGAEAATGLAVRIMDGLLPPIAAGPAQHELGVAIGVSLTPQDGVDIGELFRRADIALYRAKNEKGKASAMRFFEGAMDVYLKERDTLERELRKAIATRSIRSFYQPLVDLQTGGVVAFEALARWTSPLLGVVPPDRFITIAEDVGLIAPLTDLLLEQACTDAVAWPADITLSFNVSAALLQDPSFGLRVVAIMTRAGLTPSRLELEITESALVRDLPAAVEILGALRDLGIRIALDDFGTGYSSLYHLRSFKIDKIKIDRSFIDAMSRDPESETIVRALVGLGNGLGLAVTAEGIETAEQKHLLVAQGCGQGQGYLFSAAMEGAAVLAFVSEKDRHRHASVDAA